MKILLAEDDNNIALIAKVALEKMGGHEVHHVVNGQLAINQLKQDTYDLILLDSMMPEKDGLTTCKEIKSESVSDAPVIFLSAKSQESDIAEGLESGAIGYIQKPFDPANLDKEIADILREKAA